MTITKYKTRFLGFQKPVEKVQVERETAKSVYIKGFNGKEERRNKITDYDCYFDTFDEAVGHLIRKENESIKKSEAEIEWANQRIEKSKEEIEKLKLFTENEA